MVRCPQCGYPNPDERPECFKCGAQVSPPADVVEDVQPSPSAPPVDATLMNGTPAAPTLQATRFCYQCGNPLLAGASFCHECGCSSLGLPKDDQSINATVSVILGVIGLAAWIIPLIGLFVSTIGLILGMRGIKSTKKTSAIAGIVICIIGLALTILVFFYHALKVTGQLPNT